MNTVVATICGIVAGGRREYRYLNKTSCKKIKPYFYLKKKTVQRLPPPRRLLHGSGPSQGSYAASPLRGVGVVGAIVITHTRARMHNREPTVPI